MVALDKQPAVVILQPSALPLAEKIAGQIHGKVHGPKDSAAAIVYGKFPEHLTALFIASHPIIAICASGILVRILGKRLSSKTAEPPIVAVSENGAAIVPVLGGHNGANRLAREIATLTQGTPAITTTSDTAFGVSLDDPPPGFTLANRQHVKPFVTAMLAGAPVALEGSNEWLATHFVPPASGGKNQTQHLKITTSTAPISGSPTCLVYHPHTLALGVGCERGVSPEELITHVEAALTANDLARQSVAAVFSLDLKADEAAIHALARHLGRPARFFTAVELNAEAERLANPSETVLAEVGCLGVAEGTALAAAGPGSILVVEKTKSSRTTCAIAEAPAPIINLPGKPQGRLFVVGLGPGTPDWRSPAATRALENATDWVGYGLYLDLAADLLHTQTEHRFPLGDEEPRVRHAIALATEGKDVALICSGDAGIYAMAALVYEVLDIAPQRIALDIIPGISAFQAAAARAGALIGHDFCCISLSDLLTPWEVIENRLNAAAAGDFVTAFYNPRSKRRTTQLERAVDIFTPHRTPDTPVVIASNLGRPTEAVKIVPLSAFDPADVDMLTLVMIGSSQSKTLTRGDGNAYAYTPRGYAKKRDSQ